MPLLSACPCRGLTHQALAIRLNYEFCRFDRWEVFPDSQRCQPYSGKTLIGVAISRTVRLDLPAPEVGTGPWHDEVVRAAVPEATIDEDVQADPCEYNVGASSAVERQRMIDPEPHANSVQ
jgi:hypothetical protein